MTSTPDSVHAEHVDTSASALPNPSGAPAALRVLVVDDNAYVRASLVQLLRELGGFDVVGHVKDGQEAILAVRTLRPDVILTDVAMPGLDGIGVTRQLSAEFPGLRVVAHSAYGSPYADAMRQAGAAAFVAKGAPIRELFATLRRVCAA